MKQRRKLSEVKTINEVSNRSRTIADQGNVAKTTSKRRNPE
jgi:hypothetical protein